MKKLLLLYASVGSGHQAAAEAIGRVVGEQHNDVEITAIDVLSPNKARNPFISDLLAFLPMVLFPSLYHWAWRSGAFVRLLNRAYASQAFQKRFEKIYQAIQPDIAVCTHSLPCS